MKLITIKELITVLNISRGTIYRLCEMGMPHYRVGQGYRFDVDDVKRWLAENRQNLAAITAVRDDQGNKD